MELSRERGGVKRQKRNIEERCIRWDNADGEEKGRVRVRNCLEYGLKRGVVERFVIDWWRYT